MKFIYSLITALAFTVSGFAQDGLYIKYEAETTSTGEEADMMAMMMNGSSMELASDGQKSLVKTQMGTMMTISLARDTDAEQLTVLMTGMMGDMAFQGNPDAIDKEEEESTTAVDVELTKETKKILGYKCKKAIVTDIDGNEMVYWWTKKFDRPEVAENMPEEIPGLCLQMEIPIQEGLMLTYTAVELNDKIDMDDYALVLPEGIEVQSLEAMSAMGEQ